MRLATRIVTMNDDFSEAMRKNGCTVKFDSGPPRPLDTISAWKARSKKRSSTSGILQTPCENEIPESQRVDSESDFIKKYPELYDILHNSEEQDSPITDNILAWI